jgi:hypothetical protein
MTTAQLIARTLARMTSLPASSTPNKMTWGGQYLYSSSLSFDEHSVASPFASSRTFKSAAA